MTTMYTADALRAIEETDVDDKTLQTAALEAIDGMLAAREGLGDSLFAHLTRLRNAVMSHDVMGAMTELRDLLNHLLGEEGLRGAEPPKGWLTLVLTLAPIVLQLIKDWRNR